MDKQKEQNLSQLMEDVDALVEDSDQLVKDAVQEHRKREKIKNMDMPLLWSQEELYEKKIVFTGMRQREVLNAFREVRIRLLQRHRTDNMVVLVSSVAADVPSSYFSFNLAATFALDQHKTALYVDCNPYTPVVEEKYVAATIESGLFNYLTDYTVSLKNIIYPTGVERLRVIPSGGSSDSAAEFFNSRRMEVLIAEIKSRYPDRFIVLDAPSIQLSTEARILSRYCDYALLVVPFGKVVTDEVLSAVDAVGKEKFAGVVFNN